MTSSIPVGGAELSRTYDDRSRLFGYREIFVIAGMTVVLAIPATLELTGYNDQASKVASMGWFCLILFPLLWVPDSHQSARSHVPWDEAINVLVGNTLMWRLLAADLASGFGTAAPTLLRSMMVDLTDEDELKSGEKRSGLFFALLTTTIRFRSKAKGQQRRLEGLRSACAIYLSR